MVSRTAKYYHTHPAARKKKAEYDKKFNQKKEQREKRVELVQHNREHDKKYGKRHAKEKTQATQRTALCTRSLPSTVVLNQIRQETVVPVEAKRRNDKLFA
jgi:hypothetical protein